MEKNGWNQIGHVLFSDSYTLITSNGGCKHVDGRYIVWCFHTDKTVSNCKQESGMLLLFTTRNIQKLSFFVVQDNSWLVKDGVDIRMEEWSHIAGILMYPARVCVRTQNFQIVLDMNDGYEWIEVTIGVILFPWRICHMVGEIWCLPLCGVQEGIYILSKTWILDIREK